MSSKLCPFEFIDFLLNFSELSYKLKAFEWLLIKTSQLTDSTCIIEKRVTKDTHLIFYADEYVNLESSLVSNSDTTDTTCQILLIMPRLLIIH